MIHNPSHPGLLVKRMCLEPLDLSVTDAAAALKVSRSTMSKLINGHIGISPEMAMRLAIVFNTSEELWVKAQAAYKKQRSKLRLKQLPDLDKAA